MSFAIDQIIQISGKPDLDVPPNNTNQIDQVQKEIDKLYDQLQQSESKSLLRKHLTKNVFKKLREKRTTSGFSLMDVIQSGVKNSDSHVGVYMPDAESYAVFDALLDPIIEEYHGVQLRNTRQLTNHADLDDMEDLDPTGKFVISTRVRCARSLIGYAFNPGLDKSHYVEIEAKVKKALCDDVPETLKGNFRPLDSISEEDQKKLIDDHYLFKPGDRFLEAANACRYWPWGRAIFYNADKTCLVWVNEEDHMRIISMDQGGDLRAIYGRFVQLLELLESRLEFIHHPTLGNLTFCPTNIGNAMRASVHIKLPKLAGKRERLDEIAAKHHLQVRGYHGEHTNDDSGIFDISNARRLGVLEGEALADLQSGVQEIIQEEQKL